MIKMTYEELTSASLLGAVKVLVRTRFPGNIAYNVKKLIDAVTAARNKISKEYKSEIFDVFIGGEEPDASTEFALPVEESKKKEFEEAEAAFQKREVTLTRGKLPKNEILPHMLITPQELNALEPFLFELSEIPNPSNNVTELSLSDAPTPA